MPTKPLSPSEIELGRACLRKWAAKYNSNWPREESAVSAMGGTALHALAETYLTTGAAPTRLDAFGEMFLEALPYLPRPGTGVCEGRQEATIGGLPFVFVQDWYGPSDAIPGAPKGMPATIDHKSSKDPKRYGVFGKAAHLDNPQTLVYLARGASESNETFGRWLYYKKTTAALQWERARYIELGGTDEETLAKYDRALRTPRKPQTITSDVVLTRAELRGGLERVVLPIGEKLYRMREKGKIDPLTLPPNPAECDAFGGCPHKKRCNLSVYEQTKGYMSMASEAPSFDLFTKLPPVNGPSAVAPVNGPSAAPVQPTAPAGFQVPAWQPPGGVLTRAQEAAAVADVRAAINAPVPAPHATETWTAAIAAPGADKPAPALSAGAGVGFVPYDCRSHTFLGLIENYGTSEQKDAARRALKLIAVQVFAAV